MTAMPRQEPKVTLQVLAQSGDSIRVTPFKEGSALESTVKTSRTCPFHSQLVADRAREILAILARANVRAEGLLEELESAGQAIWLDLLPAFLKEKLSDTSVEHLLLHLDKPLTGIPWELLHDGDEFLGRRFRMGRMVSSDDEVAGGLRRAMDGPVSVLIVADPSGDLPGARKEADALVDMLEDSAAISSVTLLQGEVSLRAFRDELARHDVLHYAGHADVTARGAELRLADGAFSTRLIDQLRGRVDFPGLVFLNACGSADAARALASGADPLLGASGVAASLLLAGVRHVVGTLWEVRDEVARVFATSFYRALTSHETIGQAMDAGREAVASAHGPGSLLWAAHLLYGDPTWRLAAAENLTFSDLGVLDGLHTKYRDELLSDHAGTRLLAATMLLRLGDRTALPTVRRERELLLTWMDPQATNREQRQAALVVQALATAAGLSPSEAPDQLPDEAALVALLDRLDPPGG